MLFRPDDRVDERHQPAGDADRPEHVEGSMRGLVPRLGQIAQRRDEHDDPDRDVDEEDPWPRDQLRDRSAEDQPDRAPSDRDRRPHPERLGPVGPLLEGRRDDRERGRRDERGAEPLERTRADQHPGARREAVEQRCRREHDEPEQEEALAPEQVAHAPAEQQETAEDEGVGVDDPLEVRLRQPEVFLDRRQRDVHDRAVEDDHELREADDDEHQPPVGRMAHRSPSRKLPAQSAQPSQRVPPESAVSLVSTPVRHRLVTHLSAGRSLPSLR